MERIVNIQLYCNVCNRFLYVYIGFQRIGSWRLGNQSNFNPENSFPARKRGNAAPVDSFPVFLLRRYHMRPFCNRSSAPIFAFAHPEARIVHHRLCCGALISQTLLKIEEGAEAFKLIFPRCLNNIVMMLRWRRRLKFVHFLQPLFRTVGNILIDVVAYTESSKSCFHGNIHNRAWLDDKKVRHLMSLFNN